MASGKESFGDKVTSSRSKVPSKGTRVTIPARLAEQTMESAVKPRVHSKVPPLASPTSSLNLELASPTSPFTSPTRPQAGAGTSRMPRPSARTSSSVAEARGPSIRYSSLPAPQSRTNRGGGFFSPPPAPVTKSGQRGAFFSLSPPTTRSSQQRTFASPPTATMRVKAAVPGKKLAEGGAFSPPSKAGGKAAPGSKSAQSGASQKVQSTPSRQQREKSLKGAQSAAAALQRKVKELQAKTECKGTVTAVVGEDFKQEKRELAAVQMVSAEAFSKVEKERDYLSAEVAALEKLLAKVEASEAPATGGEGVTPGSAFALMSTAASDRDGEVEHLKAKLAQAEGEKEKLQECLHELQEELRVQNEEAKALLELAKTEVAHLKLQTFTLQSKADAKLRREVKAHVDKLVDERERADNYEVHANRLQAALKEEQSKKHKMQDDIDRLTLEVRNMETALNATPAAREAAQREKNLDLKRELENARVDLMMANHELAIKEESIVQLSKELETARSQDDPSSRSSHTLFHEPGC